MGYFLVPLCSDFVCVVAISIAESSIKKIPKKTDTDNSFKIVSIGHKFKNLLAKI